MSQPVASTSAVPALAPRSSTISRRLPGAWARPVPSSSSHAHRRVDAVSSSDVEVPDDRTRAPRARRPGGERSRAPKRPRASSSLDRNEPTARIRSSSTRRSDQGEERAAAAARPVFEASPRRVVSRRPRVDAASAPNALAAARVAHAPPTEYFERPARRPSPPRARSTSPPPASLPSFARSAGPFDHDSPAAQRAASGRPTPPSTTYPPAYRRPHPPDLLMSTTSSSTSHPLVTSSSRSSVLDVPPRPYDSQPMSWASSHAPTSSFTPSYIRDRYAAPPSSAPPRHAAPPSRRRRAPLPEPKRGPAPLELLFDGQDARPGSTRPIPRPPPHPPTRAPAPAAGEAPPRRHVPPSLLPSSIVEAETIERARREREAVEAEERRRRIAWTSAAQACVGAVAPSVPPHAGGTAQDVREELPRVLELPQEHVAQPKLSVEVERELRALFSPPMSPPIARPSSPVSAAPTSASVPPPPPAAPMRTASPELFLGIDTSPRQPLHPLPTHPPSLPPPPSTTSGERTARSRSRSAIQPGVDTVQRSTTTESAAALTTLEPSYEPEGSPELVMGLGVERKKPSSSGGTGPPRRGKQVAASARVKGKGRKRYKGKPWTVLEPEDTWWTRDLDEERAAAASAPVDWAPPEQPGWRALEQAESIQQSLELTIRELVLPTSLLPYTTLETGRCLVDLRVSLYLKCEREPASLLLCEREMRVGLVVERGESADPASRSFRLEHPRPFPLFVDPASLNPRGASSLSLSVSVAVGDEALVAQQVVAASHPFAPLAVLLPFSPRLAADPRAVSPHIAGSSTSSPRIVGLFVVLAPQLVHRLAPPSSPDITSVLSARLERLVLHREGPSGVWVPDAVAVRSPSTSVPHGKRMPRLEGGEERPGFDFLTKVPYASGEPVRLFAHDWVETTRAAMSSKDEEISRSSMTADEKLLTRMQVRWCLVNPFPPTVYHRERACWVHYAPLISRFALRTALVLHLVRHLLAHKLVTEPQLREIVQAVDREVERVESGERQDYDQWRRDVEWESRRS